MGFVGYFVFFILVLERSFNINDLRQCTLKIVSELGLSCEQTPSAPLVTAVHILHTEAMDICLLDSIESLADNSELKVTCFHQRDP